MTRSNGVAASALRSDLAGRGMVSAAPCPFECALMGQSVRVFCEGV